VLTLFSTPAIIHINTFEIVDGDSW